MIGRFPWDPFPPGTPDPKGPDPLQALLYRSAVTGGDAFRAVRTALRREPGVLRVGNRFVPEGRYREVAFVAVGHAANSMALAVLSALDERVTRGFVAAPDAVAAEIPFRGVELPPGWGGGEAAAAARGAIAEIALDLRESDLLLLLLSPGAIRGLGQPPPGMAPPEFGRFLEWAHERGATGREVQLLARTLGSGGPGDAVVPTECRADVETLVVERGDGPTPLGGGPTIPVRPAERTEARAVLDRLGLAGELSAGARDRLVAGGALAASLPPTVHRPVVVAGPPDALRAAADTSFEKGWTARLASLELRDRPEAAADRFLELVEGLARAERLGTGSPTKGLTALAMLTLDLPEGVDEGPALATFLRRARAGISRREMSVGLFRTSGAIAGATGPPGAVVGAPADPAGVLPGEYRAVPMRPGITDVGLVAAAVLPAPTGAPPR
ncbi:MAG TPA: DUF4147 domain-containing protein [Thermoplasmata archaeon]|nr:DUF4147 domain-containing protein [Thermoplasmata archaeon]